MTKTVTALGAPRLSQDTDESTSIERQKAGIDGWADLRANVTGDNYRVAYPEVIDTDISGAVSPFDRPGLGPYLRRPLLDTWQVLVVYRLDRLTRSIEDFEKLWKCLEANGKTLVSVAEQVDFGTPAGRLMARQLVLFAEYEREMIKARVKSAYDAARSRGQYTGMQFPFGYIPAKLSGKGWELVPHPEYGPLVEDIADRVIAGEKLTAICQWLEDTGIPTPRNVVRMYGNERRIAEGKQPKLIPTSKWDTTSLVSILKSPTIVGKTTADGKTFRDSSGMAIRQSEPLIDDDKWEAVKAVLEDNAARIGPKAHVSPLLRVAVCNKCGGPMNSHSSNPKKSGQAYRYYYCVNQAKKRGCDAKQVRADKLEAKFELALMFRIGSLNIIEERKREAIDYSTEITELAEAIGELTKQITLARVTGRDTAKLESQRSIHEANLTELAKAQELARPEEVTEVVLDETWSQCWRKLGNNWNAKNELLRRKGITVKAWRDESGEVRGVIDLGSIDTKRRFMEPAQFGPGDYMNDLSEPETP